MSLDTDDWANKLNDDEKHFIQMVLAFFAGMMESKLPEHLVPVSSIIHTALSEAFDYVAHSNLSLFSHIPPPTRRRRYSHGEPGPQILPGDAAA